MSTRPAVDTGSRVADSNRSAAARERSYRLPQVQRCRPRPPSTETAGLPTDRQVDHVAIEPGAQQRRPVRAILAGLVSLLILMALSTGSTALAAPGDLEEIDWQLREYRRDDQLQEPLPQVEAVLRFRDGEMSGTVGCNRLMGRYRLGAETLAFEAGIATSMMLCPESIMAQEQAVAALLERVAGYRLGEDGALTLVDADDLVLLVFAERVASGLTGTRWMLHAYNNGRGGVQTLLDATQITLQLRDDGQLAGKACNAYRGGFARAAAGELQLIGPIAATRMACPEPPGTNAQETEYFAALERVATYKIEGDRLTLRDADGATLAVFNAEGAAAEPTGE